MCVKMCVREFVSMWGCVNESCVHYVCGCVWVCVCSGPGNGPYVYPALSRSTASIWLLCSGPVSRRRAAGGGATSIHHMVRCIRKQNLFILSTVYWFKIAGHMHWKGMGFWGDIFFQYLLIISECTVHSGFSTMFSVGWWDNSLCSICLSL